MKRVSIEARVGTDENFHYWARANLQGCRLAPIEKGSRRVTQINEHNFGYWVLGQASVPDGTLLTFRDGCGEFMEETPSIEFWIVQANSNTETQTLSNRHNPEYYIKGRFEILAHGVNAKARRLEEWWLTWAPLNGGQVAPIARWLGEQIKTRYKSPRSCPESVRESDQDLPEFDPAKGWDFEDDIRTMRESVKRRESASLPGPPVISQVDIGSGPPISVHDNIVYGYLVTCDDWSSSTYRLVIYTEYFQSDQEVEYTDIVFSNVITHRFEAMASRTVIFDVEETEPRAICDQDEASELIKKGIQVFRVQSSCGLDGWVWAEKMELIPREKRKEFS